MARYRKNTGEWTGYATWKQWQDAGVVGDRLDFSDDPIMLKQVVGFTGDVIGKCRAMDAAVSFSLASAGPSGDLEPEDLLNDYTRGAYIIETRKVGYGVYRDPDAESCGHDEVNNVRIYQLRSAMRASIINDTIVVELYNSRITNQNIAKILEADPDAFTEEEQTQLLAGADAYLEDEHTGETNKTRLSWRVDADMKPMELYMLYLRGLFPEIGPLLDAPEPMEIVYRNNHPVYSSDVTNGVCAWADTYDDVDGVQVKKNCSHHDGAMITGWAMMTYESGNGYRELYPSARVHGGWNRNMLKHRDANSPNWVHWTTARRSLIQSVDDKKVLSLIKKALGRMAKRNDNVISKRYKKICNTCGTEHRSNVTECCEAFNEEGESIGHSFRRKERGKNATWGWNSWAWLAEITEYIRVTRSRNRKAGEEANGWEYYATSTRKSYGMEISEFAWRPANDEDVTSWTFTIGFTGKSKNYSYGPSWQNALAFSEVLLYPSKEAAKEAAESIFATIFSGDGIVARRKYVEGEIAPKPNYQIKYHQVSSEFVMNGDVVPEDYLCPSELHELALAASPDVVASHMEKFDEWDTNVECKKVKAPKPEGEGE
jgi:hypothetical protein